MAKGNLAIWKLEAGEGRAGQSHSFPFDSADSTIYFVLYQFDSFASWIVMDSASPVLVVGASAFSQAPRVLIGKVEW